ncbi:MAG: type IV pilin protein [Thiobacillaceae bacterium]
MSGQRGFTLIELLVAVAIVAILATVAVASYQDHIRRSARAEAKAVLMEAAGFMERFYTTNGRYSTDPEGTTAPALTGLTQSPKEGTARYNISVSAIAAQSYTLQAVPTGAQAGDECGTLTLTHTGVKGMSGDANGNGTAGDAEDVQQCWNR